MADDLAGGAHVVGADPVQTFRLVPAAEVDHRESVGDQPAQLLDGRVAAEEETAVGEADPAQRFGPGGPRAAGARPREQHQVVAALRGLPLHAHQERVVRVLHIGRERRGEAEHPQQVVARRRQPAGRRVGDVTETAGRLQDLLPGLLRDRGPLSLVREHQRDRGLRDPGEPCDLRLARAGRAARRCG